MWLKPNFVSNLLSSKICQIIQLTNSTKLYLSKLQTKAKMEQQENRAASRNNITKKLNAMSSEDIAKNFKRKNTPQPMASEIMRLDPTDEKPFTKDSRRARKLLRAFCRNWNPSPVDYGALQKKYLQDYFGFVLNK